MTIEACSTRLIAGQVPLVHVMAHLAGERPVFHSEADLQHGFARALWELAPEVRSRLEVRQHTTDRVERLDLLCAGPSARTAIEFKYWTRRWTGDVGPDDERFILKSQAATDLARRNFIFDIARLERFCDRADQQGLALIVSNDPLLWTPPPEGKRTRDHDFRIHQGRTLEGTLLWAGGSYVPNTRVLHGSYPLDWQPYSQLPGPCGEFRYLAVFIDPRPGGSPV
ncbi:hypothetical protein JKV81_13565 [Streptomyces sp. For3]|nr:hypothetical protein [Streptomyces silvae]